jgi:hypothetical protein
MTSRAALLAAVSSLGVLASSCSHSKPAAQPAPSTSRESLRQRIVRDATSVRNALTSGQADEAFLVALIRTLTRPERTAVKQAVRQVFGS